MESKRPTIYRIAEMAGVSIGTVSRVINGKDRVAPDTRARVLAIAEKFNFRPNAAARGLATRRTNTIMMLVSDVGNVYFSEMAKEISRHARDRGFRVILGDSDEMIEREAEHLRTLPDGHVDGAIIAPLTTPSNLSLYDSLKERRFPIVLLDTNLEDVAVSSVCVDNELGGRMAVEYLATKGHRRIAFLCGNIDFQTNRLRFQGYRVALSKLRIPVSNEYFVLNQDFLQEEKFCGIESLLSLPAPPTAIFVSSDLAAIACIRKITALGRRVPEDVAVIGFDDLLISSLLDIPLTTVRQPKSEIARKAVEFLIEQIENDKDDRTVEHLLLPPTIIQRRSA